MSGTQGNTVEQQSTSGSLKIEKRLATYATLSALLDIPVSRLRKLKMAKVIEPEAWNGTVPLFNPEGVVKRLKKKGATDVLRRT